MPEIDFNTTILCFDRDLTIDVNFPDNPDTIDDKQIPEDADPVPLEWVQHWTHETDYPVWATGNQHLRSEAAIPGIEDAESIWEAYWTGEYEYENDTTYYDKPARRDGLRIIQDVYDALFPETDFEYIVVDDVDLTDMASEGWTHYYPWDFVDAVRDQSAPVEQPPADTPVPGRPMQSDDIDYDTDWTMTSPHVEQLHEIARNRQRKAREV